MKFQAFHNITCQLNDVHERGPYGRDRSGQLDQVNSNPSLLTRTLFVNAKGLGLTLCEREAKPTNLVTNLVGLRERDSILWKRRTKALIKPCAYKWSMPHKIWYFGRNWDVETFNGGQIDKKWVSYPSSILSQIHKIAWNEPGSLRAPHQRSS